VTAETTTHEARGASRSSDELLRAFLGGFPIREIAKRANLPEEQIEMLLRGYILGLTTGKD
jgi:hypothetical protein